MAVSVVRGRFPDVSHLSPPALDAWLRDAHRPAPQIVDARSEEEFEVSHLATARRIDPESKASTALSTLSTQSAPSSSIVQRSSRSDLARRLQNAGRRDVWNLEGGIFAWANAGLPVERAGQNTRRVHPYSRFFTRLLKPQKPDFRTDTTRG
jgi:rhodanese-related sulfurtransferase